MSINRSLYIGLSGMSANAQALSQIGNNIANMNTVGYKGTRAVFQDILGQNILGSAQGGTVGLGVRMVDAERLYKQGALLGTGLTTDLAIDGQGFFVLKGDIGQESANFFSRAGQFHLNNEGFVVNPSGLKLMGYSADATGNIGATLGPLKPVDAPFPPAATTKIKLAMNLQSSSKVKVDGGGNALVFDPTDPDASANFSTSVTLYDKLGQAYQADVYFQKTASNEWDFHVLVDGGQLDGGTAGIKEDISAGTLQFDGDGNLIGGGPLAGSFTPTGAADPVDFTIDFANSTQWSGDSTVAKLSQDGAQSGIFQGIDIQSDGTITGTFSNGKTRIVGQVALARFRSTHGLDSVGNTLFVETPGSGAVTIGRASTGGLGKIHSGALEQSNVDLAEEFTALILAQRGYQANTRNITTADQMMQETLNLKR